MDGMRSLSLSSDTERDLGVSHGPIQYRSQGEEEKPAEEIASEIEGQSGEHEAEKNTTRIYFKL